MADGMGDMTLAVASNTLLAWQITGDGCPDTCVPTYQFGAWTLTVAQATAGGVDEALGYDIDDYVGFSEYAGTTPLGGQVFGTVKDCALAPVQDALVEVRGSDGGAAPRCAQGLALPEPCLAYFDDNGLLDPGRPGTNRDGRFAILGIPPGTLSLGIVRSLAGASPTPVGRAVVPVFTQSVSLVTVYPLGA
jgi:hypothetical protein